MRLIIQVPCYNEEETLGLVLKELPTKVKWVDEIKTMIIDDGSSDKTIEVAKKYKVDFILKHIGNKGLGNSFKTWVEKALLEEFDILVNTDWDNQYPWKYIEDLIQPIVKRNADIVIWDRQTSKIKHFSFLKKILQFLGSFMVRFLSWTNVPDSVSWFRAYSRESLLRLNVTSDFSYAVDTLVQAWSKKLKIDYIKMHTNAPTRPSRLFKNIWQHIYKTTSILLRTYSMYNPIRLFFTLASIFFVIWILGISRFMYFYIQNPVDTWKIQSLIMASIFLIIWVQFFALWIIWDLIAKNRKLIEDNLYYSKKQYFDK